MILKEILAISGEQGLFKFIAQGKNSIIVEHIETKKRSSFFGSAKISSLDEILMFTNGEDIPLSKVLDAIYDKENGGPAIDPKSSNDAIKAYFETVLPDYDRNRVYVSDMKKLFQWYNFLQRNNMLVKETPEEEKKEENQEEQK